MKEHFVSGVFCFVNFGVKMEIKYWEMQRPIVHLEVSCFSAEQQHLAVRLCLQLIVTSSPTTWSVHLVLFILYRVYTLSYLYSSPVTFPIPLCLCSINLQNRARLVISPWRLFLLIRLQNRSTWMGCCRSLMCFPHQRRAQSCQGCLKWQWNQWCVCCTCFVFMSWLCCCRMGKIEGGK